MHRAWASVLAALLLVALTGCCCGPCGRPCVCSLGCGEWYFGDWLDYGEPCDACGNWVGGWDGDAAGYPRGGYCTHCGRGYTTYAQPYASAPADQPAYADDGYGISGTPAEFGLEGVQDFRIISDRPVNTGEPTPAEGTAPQQLKQR
jgi:hypothetical protein